MQIIVRRVTFLMTCLLTRTDVVVASIEETAERYHIPKPFIGLILLPIVVRLAFPEALSICD